MRIELYDYTLVILLGARFSGKTTFAKKYFRDYEICTSDEPDFSKMIQVMDGEFLEGQKRRDLLRAAKNENWRRIGIIFDLDEEILLQRKTGSVKKNTVLSEAQTVRNISKKLNNEGFDQLYFLTNEADAQNVEIAYCRGIWDHRDESGPFDIIGDVHGCYDQLEKLIRKLGYVQDENGVYSHPQDRKIVFAGDVVDRGENSTGVLRLIMKLHQDGCAYMVVGNHDDRLRRYLEGNPIEVVHGLETTAAEFAQEDESFKAETAAFLKNLPAYLMFNEGRLVVVHAGIREEYLGKYTKTIRQYCLYGESTGEINEVGLPVRVDWAQDYTGDTVIVYGHTPYTAVMKINNAYCVDTACIYGYYLSALRYPEMKVERVKMRKKKKTERDSKHGKE